MKLAFRAPRPAALPLSRQASPSHVCRAGKKQGAKKAAKVNVPTTPPPKENVVATPEQIPTEDPVVSSEEEEEEEEEEEAAVVVEAVVDEKVAPVQAQVEVQQTMTTEEIAAQMAQLRAASKENAQKDGLVEVRFIPHAFYFLFYTT